MDFIRRVGVSCAAVVLVGTSSALAAGCIPQDINGDGKVDGEDLGLLLADWGQPGNNDFDESGEVDGGDLGELLASWGPVNPSMCLSIAGISPSSAAPGDIIKIFGNFPDPDPQDYCAVARDPQGRLAPFEVLSVDTSSDPNVLVCRVGEYDPSMNPGGVMVGLGDGDTEPPAGPPFLSFGDGAWSWSAFGPGVTSNVVFHPLAPAAPISGSFYGTLVGGSLCVTISGDCPPGSTFAIWPRAHHFGNNTPNDPYVGYDCYIPCVTFTPGLTEFNCAQAICAAIQAAYAAHVPPIPINCTTTTVATGTKITLSLVGLNIDWGMLNIVSLGTGGCTPPGTCDPGCPCDINGDHIVDGQDLLALEQALAVGCQAGVPCCADLDGDGQVTFADINLWLALCAGNPTPCP